MIRQGKTKLVLLTRQYAHGVANMPVWQGERPVKTWRHNYLKGMLDEGLLFPPHWHFIVCDGVRYRGNGQHTSGLMDGLSGPIPEGFMVIVTDWVVDSEKEVAYLYGVFDNVAQTRSRGEVVTAHARIHGELNAISSTDLTMIATGLAYAMNGGVPRGFSTADRAELIHDYTHFVEWAFPLVRKSFLRKIPIIGAIYQTYSRDEEEALKFWRYVKDETHPEKEHCTRKLADFLRVSRTIGSRNVPIKHQWPSQAFYAKCILSWNAWRRGYGTNMKYHADAPAPKVL